MKWRALVLLIPLTIAVGCARQQQAAPTPAPTEVAVATPALSPPGEARTVQNLPSYPGARQVSSSTFSGAGPTGTSGQWSVVVLETTDLFDKVRDFYKGMAPSGFTQSFTTEQSSGAAGRTYVVWFARSDDKAWHTVTVQEETTQQKVVVTLASGAAP